MTGVVRRVRVAGAAALVFVLLGTAAGHTFYATLAQVERTRDGRLEVALRFFPDDLEAALGKATGKRVVVEDTKAFAAVFEPWINSVFVLEAGRQRTAFKYVGAEVNVKIAWIYVEAGWTAPLDTARMTNVILVDLFPDQLNTVNFVDGDRRSSMVFSVTRTTADRLMDDLPR